MAVTTVGRRLAPPARTDPPGAIPAGTIPSWSTVAAIAAVLAFADGFWMIGLRGAVGAIVRTQHPFASFWRESLIALPLFAAAVLAALMIAGRQFGPEPTRRQTVTTAALVALAGSLVGVGQLIVSSVYDFQLQKQQMSTMGTMRGTCLGPCVEQHIQLTLIAHIKGVAMVSGFLVLTDAILVLWLVALLGGRLIGGARPLDAPGRRDLRSTKPSNRSGTVDATGTVHVLLAAGLAGSAAIHAAVIPEHLEEWTAAGAFFVGLTVAELAVAAAVLTGRSGGGAARARLVASAAAAVSLLPLLVWAWSRFVGLPVGPEPGEREAIGVPDVLACALEIGTLLAAAWLHRRTFRAAAGRQGSGGPAAEDATPRIAPSAVRALVVLSVLAVTAFGIAGVFPDWLGGFGGGADGSSIGHGHGLPEDTGTGLNGSR